MKVLKFMISWQFWVSLVLAILLSYGLLKGTFLWLNAYTNHGVEVSVPNLKDLTLDQAIVKLDQSDLQYEIDTSKYNPQYKPYQILDIYPLINSNVKKGRRIFIRANAKTWKPVAIPNIIGRYKYLGFSQLELVGLKVQDTIYEPNLAVNTVLRLLYKGKEVQPGVMLPRFSALTIVLGKGLAKNVSVPSFIGLDEETAKRMIGENLFSVGAVNYDDSSNKANARIYYQVPVPSSAYDQGQPIDLYLSSKPPEELKNKIKELDNTFNRNFSRINYSDSLDINSIYTENSGSTPIVTDPPSNPSVSGEGNKPKPPKEEPNKPNRVIIE